MPKRSVCPWLGTFSKGLTPDVTLTHCFRRGKFFALPASSPYELALLHRNMSQAFANSMLAKPCPKDAVHFRINIRNKRCLCRTRREPKTPGAGSEFEYVAYHPA